MPTCQDLIERKNYKATAKSVCTKCKHFQPSSWQWIRGSGSQDGASSSSFLFGRVLWDFGTTAAVALALVRGTSEQMKRARACNGDVIETYTPKWCVLSNDLIFVQAPETVREVRPDIYRGLILLADRALFSSVSPLFACTKMLGFPSMVSKLVASFNLCFPPILYFLRLNIFSLFQISGCSLGWCYHRQGAGYAKPDEACEWTTGSGHLGRGEASENERE